MRTKISTMERMEKQPIPQLILYLSVPSVISMLITNIYNLVDTAYVGRLGTSASGAVGIVFGFMSIIQAFGFLFGQGSGSLLSRSLGKKDFDKATTYSSTGFWSSFLSGLLVSVIGFIFLDQIIFILGSTSTIFPFAKDYIFYILIASPFMASSFTLNNILRYEGKAYLGMIGLATGAFLNMVGDPILMFRLNMGISGAGLSTAFSQVISWLILVSMFLLKKSITSINPIKSRFFNPYIMFEIITTGAPSLIRQGLSSFTTVLLNSECALFGDAAVSAMSIVNRIFFFAFSIVLGIGQGFQPVSGFSYGGEHYKRLRQAFWFTIGISEIIMIIECIGIYLSAGSLIQVFRDDPAVVEIGTRALRLQTIAQIFLPPCTTTEMLFQSIGKRIAASFLSSLRNGILFIPSLLILTAVRGLSGIQEAQPLALVLSFPITVPFIFYFFRRLPK